jgi:hypothetical protein
MNEQSILKIQFGRRNRETGYVQPLSGPPRPDWWGESQETWEHVQRFVQPWIPVDEAVGEER